DSQAARTGPDGNANPDDGDSPIVYLPRKDAETKKTDAAKKKDDDPKKDGEVKKQTDGPKKDGEVKKKIDEPKKDGLAKKDGDPKKDGGTKKDGLAKKDGTGKKDGLTKNPDPPPAGAFPRRALAVTVNNYVYTNHIGGRNGLPNVRDQLTKKLRVPASQIVELSDAGLTPRQPVKPVIEKLVTDFLAGSRGQDCVVVLFVGHAVEAGDEAY